jgi:AraC-like DNA-binding protein
MVYGRLEATAPWGISIEGGKHAMFIMVSRGNCWLTLEKGPKAMPLTGGDFFLLAPGNSHTLSDSPHTPARKLSEILPEEHGEVIHYGGGGTPTTIIGGKFAFDETSAKPLTDLLPPFIQLRADQTRTFAVDTTLQLLAAETAMSTPGSQLVINRLADILVIQAIRAHVTSEDCTRTGWLRALIDQQIGAALRSMHEKLEHPWTVGTLAMEAGMSRSAFALRFKDLVGEPPLEYLTRWRIYQASCLLRESDKKLVDVAKLVGYDSDGTLNKAFKRIVGIAPGEYRRNGTRARCSDT